MDPHEGVDPATLNLMLVLQFQDARDAARQDRRPGLFSRLRQWRRRRRSQAALDRELARGVQHEYDDYEQRRGRRAPRPATPRRTTTTTAQAARREVRGRDSDSDYEDELRAALAASRISASNHAAAAAWSSYAATGREARAGYVDDFDDDSDNYSDDYSDNDSDNDSDLLAALAASRDSARSHAGRSSSSSAADPPAAAPPECVSCMEAVVPPSPAIHLPCSHAYCAACMASLLRAALDGDEPRLFPARCCGQALPVAEDPASSALLPAGLVARYRARQREHGACDRTYCPWPSCGRFIPVEAGSRSNRATCMWCERATCTRCKRKWHGEGECVTEEDDAAARETLRVAEEMGWRRCISCRTVVERSWGCNHMSKLHLFSFFLFRSIS